MYIWAQANIKTDLFNSGTGFCALRKIHTSHHAQKFPDMFSNHKKESNVTVSTFEVTCLDTYETHANSGTF